VSRNHFTFQEQTRRLEGVRGSTWTDWGKAGVVQKRSKLKVVAKNSEVLTKFFRKSLADAKGGFKVPFSVNL